MMITLYLLQDITSFSEKLKDVKFAEFSTLSSKQMEELDKVLNVDIPKLMEVSASLLSCCVDSLYYIVL